FPLSLRRFFPMLSWLKSVRRLLGSLVFRDRLSISTRRSRSSRPRVEELEPRWVPTTLTWNGPAAGLWDNAANWDRKEAPKNGDTLIFTGVGGKDTNSTDNITGLALERLIVKPGYQSTITLNKSLIVNSNATIEGGQFAKGDATTLVLGADNQTLN